MKKFSLLQGKLNNEKGITGVDIVVSITLIILSISVIMAVYVNVSNAVNSANRNAGATKIVTSLAEKIELTYYDALQSEFENLVSVGKFKYKPYTIDKVTGKTINAASPATKYAYNGVYTIDHANMPLDFKPFGIKVPKGYNLEIEVQNVINLEEGATEPVGYDLIKEFDITVSYMVSGEKKEVTINVIKAIEKFDDLAKDSPNKPVFNNTDYLCYNSSGSSSYNFNNLAYLKRIDNTKFKVVEEPEYEYSTEKTDCKPCYIWLGDVSKTVGDEININDDAIFVWIPAYNMNGTNPPIYKYKKTKGYLMSSVTKNDILNSAGDVNPTININTIVKSNYFADNSLLINKCEDGTFTNKDNVKALEGIWVNLSDFKNVGNGDKNSKKFFKYIQIYIDEFLEISY